MMKHISMDPSEYRLARKPDGSIILQAGYEWMSETGLTGGVEWRDAPVVDVDENGKEL